MKRLVYGLALFVALSACGGSSVKSSAAPPTDRGRSPVLDRAGSEPSESTKMICAAEGNNEIAGSVGVDTTRRLVGRWRDHVYSCDYAYGGGRVMTLSVKELSNASETTAYFDQLGARLGRMHALQGLGQGAFQTRNGSTVVRKDNRVLLVDNSRLPARFGKPSSPRADVALSVAATIMGCWTGA